jgi:tetratricopeptide (TPR) repeat protein
MKKLLLSARFKLLVLLLMLPTWAVAQKSYPERLNDSLKLTRTDSVRYWLMVKLGIYYLESNQKISLNYFEQFIAIAKKNGKTLSIADGLGGKGYLLLRLGKLPESFACLKQAEELAADPNNENKYWHFPHPELPLNRSSVLVRVETNMGNLMGSTGNTEQAIAYCHKVINLATKIAYRQYIGLGTLQLAGAYLNINKPDSALLFLRRAELLFERTGYKTYLGEIYQLTGDIYLTKGDTSRALQYYHRALRTDAEQNNLMDLGMAYASLTNYYLNLKQADSSLLYARKTFVVRKAIGIGLLGNTYKSLYRSYQLKHQIDSAYKYMERALLDKEASFDQTYQSLVDFQK